MCAKKKEMEEGEWTLSIYILLWAVAEMEQPLYFPFPLFSFSLSPPSRSFEKLSLSHSARKDLETPFPISIQVRSNTEPRFHRYWIKGLTLGCTRNYKVGCLWKSIARCISRDAVDKFSLPLIHPCAGERNATFPSFLLLLTNLNVLGVLFVSLSSSLKSDLYLFLFFLKKKKRKRKRRTRKWI